MGRKRIAALLLAAVTALGLVGCGAEKDKEDKSGHAAISVYPAKFSAEETALTELLDVSINNYRMFDFQIGSETQGVQSMMFRAYELEDGNWVDIATQVYPFSDAVGRIALTFGKMPDGVKMAVQSESGTNSSTFAPVVEEGEAAVTYATSALTGSPSVEFDEEVPLVLQFATSKSEFSTYNVEYFGMPRELAKHDYDHVYAVTVTFSQKPVSEIVQSIAPGIPQSEPSAEPSPEA